MPLYGPTAAEPLKEISRFLKKAGSRELKESQELFEYHGRNLPYTKEFLHIQNYLFV